MSSKQEKEWIQCSGKSSVWLNFLKHKDNPQVKCKFCCKIFSEKTSTTVLHYHLQNVHKVKDDQGCSASSKNLKQMQIADFRKKDPIEMVVSRLAAVDCLSFNVIASSKDIQSGLIAQGYKPPKTRQAVKDMVIQFACNVQNEVKEEIQKLIQKGSRFSITSDEYTSLRARRYMAVTVHKGDDAPIGLGMVRIKGSMPAEVGLQLLKMRLETFGLNLDQHIVASVSDGAAVMKKMMSLMSPIHQVS